MSSTQAAPFRWSQQPPSGNLQTFMSAYIDTMIIILYTKTMTVTSLTEKRATALIRPTVAVGCADVYLL